MSEIRHIHPVFDKFLTRRDKEKQLQQNSKVIWMTGLSGSGKTTLAIELERELTEKGYFIKVLDGDNVRSGINNNLGFEEADRVENIRRIAEVSKLFLDCGVITINCFVSPTNSMRDLAKKVIGKEDFIQVFVNTPLEECEKRDVKGLYQKARKGEIKNFTGIDAPFEEPVNPEITINTVGQNIKESSDILIQKIIPHIKQ